MIRGTTPQVVIKTNIPLDNIKEVWLTYSNDKKSIVITKKLSDCEIVDGQLISYLTQEDTIKLNPDNINIKVSTQVRILTTDDKAFASKVQRLDLESTVTEGMIYD